MVMNAEFPEPVQRLERVLAGIRRRHTELPVLAIPWIRFKHPIHPTQLELAQEDPAAPAAWRETLLLPLRFLRCLLTVAHMTLQLALLQVRLRGPIKNLKTQRFNLVAKSWAYSERLVPGLNDFYYGDLQQRLSNEGVRTLLLTGKPENMGWRDFAKASASISDLCQLPEMALAPLSMPVRLAFRQWPVTLRLLREAAAAEDPFEKTVLFRAARDCISPGVTWTSLFYGIGREATRIWKPKAFLSLYEGYGWEDCLWRGVKEQDARCKTVGYQHTILLRHNLTMLRPAERRFPELVLCLGPRPEQMLRASHPGSELFSFGTFRKVPASALSEPNPGRKTVLVVPTGYPDETELLFNATLQLARSLPDHRFILRTHPVLPFEEILPMLEGDPSALPNVELSRAAPIEHDFARASAALYRGSSSILYGILYGLKPVFYSDGLFPDQDPLFELQEWVERVSSAEAAERLLRNYSAASPEAARRQWEPAARYVASYTVPVRPESVGQLLSRLNLKETEPLLV